MKNLLLLAAVVAISSAHLCLIFPHQRGTMQDLNTLGATDCNLIEEECGMRPAETPQVTFQAGENVSLIFQINVNHIVDESTTPGLFEVAIGDDTGSNFKSILTIENTNISHLTLYTPYVIIPKDKMMSPAILQVKYVTMNPAAVPVYYQCADIYITYPGSSSGTLNYNALNQIYRYILHFAIAAYILWR